MNAMSKVALVRVGTISASAFQPILAKFCLEPAVFGFLPHAKLLHTMRKIAVFAARAIAPRLHPVVAQLSLVALSSEHFSSHTSHCGSS